jgi:hypothetical protein
VVAGGVAANLHGSVRATKDVDILVPREEANMARVLGALSQLPYGIARELNAAEISRNPITIVGDDPRVDILTLAWTVTFEQAWVSRVVRRIGGVRIPYLGREDLIASKRTGRPADQADIEVLEGPATSSPLPAEERNPRSGTRGSPRSRPASGDRS